MYSRGGVVFLSPYGKTPIHSTTTLFSPVWRDLLQLRQSVFLFVYSMPKCKCSRSVHDLTCTFSFLWSERWSGIRCFRSLSWLMQSMAEQNFESSELAKREHSGSAWASDSGCLTVPKLTSFNWLPDLLEVWLLRSDLLDIVAFTNRSWLGVAGTVKWHGSAKPCILPIVSEAILPAGATQTSSCEFFSMK
jgi:hypothetical protein